MGEYQAFEYSNWLQHTVTLTEMTVYEYRDYLNEANKKIIEAKALVGEIEELEAIEYEDMTSILEKGMLDLENIRKYGVDSGLYWRVREADRKLYEKLQKKVVEKFSLIKIEDIKVPNNKGLEIVTVGLKEGSPHISKREKKELTLADFASSIKKEEVTYMDGFAEVIFGEQASIETQKEVLENVKNAGGIDQTKVSEEQLAEMELGTYLMKNAEQFQNMRSSDEIDHKTCSQAVMFASEMLDILIVPAVVKAITGYDYITGEQLSGFERGVKGVQAAVETIAIGAAIAKGLGGVGVACVVGEEGAEEVTGRGIGVLCETAGLSPEASLLINVGLVAAGMGSAKKVKKIEEIVEESSDASKHLDDIVDSSIKKVDDAYQTSYAQSSEIVEKIEGGNYIVGDANFMDADDAFLKNISNRADIDANGYYDVIGHGTQTGIQITHNGKKIIVDSRTATRLILNSEGYNGQAIRLLSCNTGGLDTGFAQNLSNKLNVEVYAPTNYLWSTSDGKYFVAGMTKTGMPDMSDLGTFKLFVPGGN